MKLVLLLIASLVGAIVIAGAEPPQRFEMPDSVHGYASLHYPKSFRAGDGYHLLFWFHGTGGRPNPGIGRIHDSYITVGMSYLKRDKVPPGEYGLAHWRECLAVRADLERQGFKLRRNVVAGMSKGGWASFYIGADVKRDGPDAIAIFAAGKDARYKQSPRKMSKDLSLLVGVGETDPNFPQSQLAVRYFREGGARVFYEEWLGEGHVYHASPRVVSWLEVESKRDRPDELKRIADRKVGDELVRCRMIRDSRQRYLALRILIGDPHMPYASEALRERVRKAGSVASAEAALQPWLSQFNTFRTVVGKEADFFDHKSFDVPKLKLLVDRFRDIMTSTSDPALAARAAHGARRARKMHAIYEAQTQAFENPEYKALNAEYRKLQKAYSDAGGKPGPEIMAQLKEIGAKLGDMRFNASIEAFRDAERRKPPPVDPDIEAAIKADPENELRPYSGLGF